MPKTGPKPIDVDLLKQYAEDWSVQLLSLRDGRPGKLYWLGIGTTKPIIAALVIPPKKNEFNLLGAKKLRDKKGTLWLESPVFPEPTIWQDLKAAKSTHEILDSITGLERYLRKRWPPPPDDVFLPRRPAWDETVWSKRLEPVKKRANELLTAMDLPQYPRAQRPTSDDKRIEFFAKVLSGLALGRTPIYTLKILAGWVPPSISYKAPSPARPTKKGREESA